MMNGIRVNKNERSWAIELISQINSIAENYELVIKRAGGESTISAGDQRKMFPDVILYRDKQMNTIAQGWEIKMPDVPITDYAFVKDAQRKAKALGLTSFVIWNFTSSKFFVLNEENETFEEKRRWYHSNIITRQDVEIYRKEWEMTLKDVVLTVNEYLISNDIKTVSLGEVISKNALDLLINENKTLVADHLRKISVTSAVISAEISEWWKNIKQEYTFDEYDGFTAYAKNIILNWAYRILFAHIIKRFHKEAFKIENINYDSTPEEANQIFAEITNKCDFYNIFAPMQYNSILPIQTWNSLIELSNFLKSNGIQQIDQSMLQNVLERCVNVTRRELNGQFTTPKTLAEILVSITILNWEDDCYDPCCGTGTIAKEILSEKKQKIGVSKAIETTWASDKYQVPLQIANVSLTASDTINEANKIFQENALSVKIGNTIKIVDPSNGNEILHAIPLFGSICSNLPFLAFESIPDGDKYLINTNLQNFKLDKKSDLSFYIALHLSSIMKEGARLGIIVSNSWLGTKSGTLFYREICKKFDLLQVHISGAGRWFRNADVVATIMILKKGKSRVDTNFFVWHKSLQQIEQDEELKESLINSFILNRAADPKIASVSTYDKNQIDDLCNLGLSYNSLFHDVNWILDLKDKLIPISEHFKVFRGSRRGWDKLFFPKKEESSKIESVFLKPALFNAKKISTLITLPDRQAFCCGLSLDVLKTKFPEAYKHIMRFADEKNGTGRSLVEVLERPNEEWYEMRQNEIADFYTIMNPDNRIFFGKFENPTFINQRLIGFSAIDTNVDLELMHALMNNMLMKFFVEALGFGRGLGVLDINKDKLAKCLILNPKLLTQDLINSIKKCFRKICLKPILTIDEELNDSDWIEYNKLVLRAYGIEDYYTSIARSLISLRNVRKAVNIKDPADSCKVTARRFADAIKSSIQLTDRVASEPLI